MYPYPSIAAYDYMTSELKNKCRSSLMGEYSGRKGVEGLAVQKRGPRPISKDLSKTRDQNVQLCNRIGCSGRLNPARCTQNVHLDKTRLSKNSSKCSSAHGKELIAENSSKGVSKVANPVKPLRARHNKSPSTSETESFASSGSTSSDVQETEVADSNPVNAITHRPVEVDPKQSQSGESSSMEIGSHSAVSTARPKRSFLKKSAISSGTSLANTAGSAATVSSPQLSRQKASATRPVSRYLRCNSAPNVESASSNRKQMLKRSSEGESSSSSSVKQPTLAENKSRRALGSRSGISVSEMRRARNAQTSFRDNVSTSIRARTSETSSALRPPQMSRRELPTDQRLHRLPNSLSANGYHNRTHNFTRPSTTESSRSRNLISPSEVSRTRHLVDREGFRHYNISGIAEMLLALDRIEHDEEISFEQTLANFYLGGLSFHDQHRDMRLDIDGMSYEELLALEERMGSVSTALSEEALAKCIKKSIYNPPSSSVSGSPDMDGCEDDTKCSICQEEYAVEDEMGILHCKHSYHNDCIDQWLRQKNWCPICKSLAASSSSSS